jgi:ketosteroid isomerase-like protein
MTPEQIVRKSFDAFHAQDRQLADTIMAKDLTFTSPQDDHISRAAYFERCFPTADHFLVHTMLAVQETSDGGVFVLYEYELHSGERYRNTEYITVRGGQIAEIQVFFGGAVPIGA